MVRRRAYICVLQIVLATAGFHSAGWADDSPFQEKDHAAVISGTQIKRMIKADFTRYDHDYQRKREADGQLLQNLAERLAAPRSAPLPSCRKPQELQPGLGTPAIT